MGRGGAAPGVMPPATATGTETAEKDRTRLGYKTITKKELVQEAPTTTTTRWIETDEARTKLIYDSKGNLIYKQDERK